jgi:hypothetical protein
MAADYLSPGHSLAEQVHEVRAQYRLAAEAGLDEHCPIRGRLLQQVLPPRNEVLRVRVGPLRHGPDRRQAPQARHTGQDFLYQPARPPAPVVGGPSLAPGKHPVEASEPLLVDM